MKVKQICVCNKFKEFFQEKKMFKPKSKFNFQKKKRRVPRTCNQTATEEKFKFISTA